MNKPLMIGSSFNVVDIIMKAVPFHQHLDICKQCSEQPMNLCPIGAMLIADITGK